ncbi:MAG TPA: NTP transferase domain-containing protein [Actinomycetales bacterium]|nr:NTP transferase domain-containing protein [Actinomycetales bacterium]
MPNPQQLPDPQQPPNWLRRVVVLAGGPSRRLGQDKLAADLGGGTVLDVLLEGLAKATADADVVVVGPHRPGPADLLRVREDPPGGGPVAGLAAGMATNLGRGLGDDDLVAVLAGDQPFAARALPVLATVVGGDWDGAVGVDRDGRDQPLLAVYRAGPLRRAIGRHPAGARVRDVVGRLRVARTPLPEDSSVDVDTVADLERAREVLRRERAARRP